MAIIEKFEQQKIAEVIYAYLVDGESHRKIQHEILNLPAPARGGGFIVMEILHHYNIRGDKKGILKRKSVNELRAKLLDILKNNPLWDKKEANLLVTNSDVQSMELRAAFSAKNASDTWDLRCQIREELIDFIKKSYPNFLPQLRKMEMKKN